MKTKKDLREDLRSMVILLASCTNDTPESIYKDLLALFKKHYKSLVPKKIDKVQAWKIILKSKDPNPMNDVETGYNQAIDDILDNIKEIK